MIVRWDEVEVGQDIGLAAGAVNVGLHRLEIAPGETAAQADAPVEEIVFVLEGSGSWENGEEMSEVHPGSCGVRLAQDQGHLLRAGKDGLTVLAFVSPIARKLVLSADDRASRTSSISRQSNPTTRGSRESGWSSRERQAQSAAVSTGVTSSPGRRGRRHISIRRMRRSSSSSRAAGRSSSGPLPFVAENTEREEHEIRAGDVVWRPPSTGIAHFFRGGDEGMTFLAYGTREPNDVCYYPRSNKIYWRGVGLVTRLESLGYDDGEPED